MEEPTRSSRPSYPSALANSSLQSSNAVSGRWNVAVGSWEMFWSCMRAEMVSKDALIFAISRCTSAWQLHTSSRRGGRWEEKGVVAQQVERVDCWPLQTAIWFCDVEGDFCCCWGVPGVCGVPCCV